MPRLVLPRRHLVGKAPGVLADAPETVSADIQILDYDSDSVHERTVPDTDAAKVFFNTNTVTWFNINTVQEQAVQRLGEFFKLHPLTREDIVHTWQRPRIEVFDEYVYIVLKMLSFAPEQRQLHAEQISIILGPSYVVSFQERAGDLFDPLRQRIRASRGRIRSMGADYLAYAILDIVVDHYFVVLEQMGEQIEEMEEEVLGDPEPTLQREINDLRRELIRLRRFVWPMREVFSQIDRSDTDYFSDAIKPFLRDAYDHTVQIIELAESLRDVLSGLMDLYMTSISNKMNEVMKVLTIIGTIFIPLTFVAGIYGMNFAHMPELQWTYSYYVFWGVILTMGTGLVIFFRRKKWL
ncbi:MAG: magnesium/cobalt transporter CorA [Bacteroidota bacterium]